MELSPPWEQHLRRREAADEAAIAAAMKEIHVYDEANTYNKDANDAERAALDKYATQRDLDLYSAEHEAQQVAAAIAASLREASLRDITPAKRPLSGA